MRPSRAAFLRLSLWAIAGAATLGGAVAWLVPPATDVSPLAPVWPDPGPPPALAVATAAAEEVVMANLFVATRTPPAARYQPVELTEESASGMVPPPADPLAGMAPDSAMLAGDVPRLLGTVVAPGGPRALLQLSLASGPRLYAVGDRDGGFTVLAIDPRVVVLRGPGGRRTLRLEPEA